MISHTIGNWRKQVQLFLPETEKEGNRVNEIGSWNLHGGISMVSLSRSRLAHVDCGSLITNQEIVKDNKEHFLCQFIVD